MDNGSKRQMPKNTDQNHKQRKRSQYAQGEWENAHDRIRIHSDTTPLTSHMQQAQIHIYICIYTPTCTSILSKHACSTSVCIGLSYITTQQLLTQSCVKRIYSKIISNSSGVVLDDLFLKSMVIINVDRRQGGNFKFKSISWSVTSF